MSGLYTIRHIAASRETLGEQLRRLREKADLPGWKVAAAAEMDSTKLSKIENGKRLPTAAQLAALAKFFKVPVEPLETRRLAEDMMKWYGGHPGFEAATAIVREEAGEYRVKKRSMAVGKPAKAVNKAGKGGMNPILSSRRLRIRVV